MKVVFRISKMGFGGAEQVFLSVASRLVEEHSCTVHFVVDNMHGKNVKSITENGFVLHSLNVNRTLNTIFALAGKIDAIKPDVVFSAYTDTNAACILSSKIASHKTTVIVSEHAPLKEHWNSQSRTRKLLLTFFVKYVYRLSDMVICVSNGLKAQVDTLMGNSNKTITIYNPVRFSNTIAAHKNNSMVTKLLAVGRITPAKDYSTLIRAVALLKAQITIELTIVGGVHDRNEFTKLQILVNDLEVTDIVIFAGYQSEVQHYYEQADLFVLSSAWEGFGNVIVEAMAFGLPVVCTDCNYGPAEILDAGKYGRLSPVGDESSLAEKIIMEVKKPLIMKKKLVERSQFFSESSIAHEYFDLIKGLKSEK